MNLTLIKRLKSHANEMLKIVIIIEPSRLRKERQVPQKYHT